RGDVGLGAGAQLAIDKGAVFLARLAMRFRATAIAGMTTIGVLRRRGLVVRGLMGRGRRPLMLWLRRGRLMLQSGVSPCRAVTAAVWPLRLALRGRRVRLIGVRRVARRGAAIGVRCITEMQMEPRARIAVGFRLRRRMLRRG